MGAIAPLTDPVLSTQPPLLFVSSPHPLVFPCNPLQAEAMGDTDRAELLHQRRLLAKNDAQVCGDWRMSQALRASIGSYGSHTNLKYRLPGCRIVCYRTHLLRVQMLSSSHVHQVWYEYGTYCLRRGGAKRGRAEECFREALALEPAHRGALLALLGCSVAAGRNTDPAYLEVRRGDNKNPAQTTNQTKRNCR